MDGAGSLRDFLARHTRPAVPELVREDGDALRCLVCAHACRIKEGRSGRCKVRFREEGELRAPWGYVAGLQVDPIEKKPFYHVMPGRTALSFGMLGCNLHCDFCQNWISSQTLRDDRAGTRPTSISAEDIVRLAVTSGSPTIVSTYNEPLITTDWAMEIFRLAKAEGLTCGYVSNGHASAEVLDHLRPHLDLYKVDLKCFRERSYERLGGKLSAVKATIERLVEMGFWTEVVTLVVPGFNDGEDELRGMAGFLAGVSPDIPWHVTAFHPDYRMADPGLRRTPSETLAGAHAIGREEGLRFVYTGNMPGRTGDMENTRCPDCTESLIERVGFHVTTNRVEGGACPACGRGIPGVWG
jgi:pyruvate formate lyase activating enzyme